MALTRKFLESLGLNKEAVEAVIQAHTDVTDALKDERDGYRSKAESVTALEQERDELKARLARAGDAAEVRAEFDAYRARVEADRLRESKLTALRGALREAGVRRDDFTELLLKAVDLDAVDIGDPAAAIEPLRQAYGACFATTFSQGTPTVDPPSASPRRLSREAIQGMSVEDINRQWEAVKIALQQ